jgi:hypothetical protein
MYIKIKTLNVSIEAPVAQWIERLFPKQKVVGSTPTWRVLLVLLFQSFLFFFNLFSLLFCYLFKFSKRMLALNSALFVFYILFLSPNKKIFRSKLTHHFKSVWLSYFIMFCAKFTALNGVILHVI